MTHKEFTKEELLLRNLHAHTGVNSFEKVEWNRLLHPFKDPNDHVVHISQLKAMLNMAFSDGIQQVFTWDEEQWQDLRLAREAFQEVLEHEKTDNSMYGKAKAYAIKCHSSTNHMYGDKPYSFHLQMVEDAAIRFIHLIPIDNREIVLAGCWVHDVIEDTRQTYNDVKEATCKDVADIAYALTNNKGKNRAERASDEYYKGIKKNPLWIFVKICDRIANMTHSKNTKSPMFDKYKDELKQFKARLFNPDFMKEMEEMFDYLEELCEDKE